MMVQSDSSHLEGAEEKSVRQNAVTHICGSPNKGKTDDHPDETGQPKSQKAGVWGR